MIIAGDLNGHVGKRKSEEDRVHGGWNFGERNSEGESIMERALAFDLAIGNTYFQKKGEKLVTYKSGKRKSQIDYILCRRKHLKEIKNVKVISGECVAAQHRLVVADCEVPTIEKGNKRVDQKEQKIKWWKLKEEGLRRKFKDRVLRELDFPETVQEWWGVNSKMIRTVGEEVVGKTSGKGPPEDKEAWWWNEEVQAEVKKKKEAKKRWDNTGKNEDREDYNTAKKNAKKAVARARAEAVEKAYEQIEKNKDDRQLLRIARTRDKASKDVTNIKQIKDESGIVLRRQDQILRRWKVYFEGLLNEENPREWKEDGEINEGMVREISRNEVEEALRKIKAGKAVGADQIPGEVWKSLGKEGTDALWDLMKKIWQQEAIPEEWKKSTLVPIYKGKGDIQDCGNYRGIKLMSHTMKVWERIIEGRLRQETVISEEQFGFMPGRGTTDAIFALRQLMEKCRERQAELHIAFIDLEKAYDRVPRQEVWRCMRRKGTPEKYVRLVKEMYERAETTVRCSVGRTEGFKVKVGLHQGSALSPYLFNLVMDVMVETVKKEAPWSMMFADDIVLCETTRERLEDKLEEWRKALEERGMRVSRTKTEYVTTSEGENLYVNLQGEKLPAAKVFKYLGSKVTSNGELDEEIKHRVNCGWLNWRRMSGVLCDGRVSCRMKGKIYKMVVRPAMLHGAETWPVTRRQERKMEVAEMKMLRWLCGVTREDRIRNERIRGTVKVGNIGKKIQESRLRWFGHVQRRNEEYVGKRVEKLEVGGRRRRGRPKTRWRDRVNEDLREKGWRQEDALDRRKWRESIKKENADPIEMG